VTNSTLNSSAKTTTTTSSADIIPLNPATAPAPIATKKSLSLEVYRERWLMQLIADPDLTAGDLRVAIAITFHMNRRWRL
jgi:hypothetical protein